MSLIDQGEGRTLSLYYNVKLTPPVDGPVGETEGAAEIAKMLQIAGSKALHELVKSQGYQIDITATCFIY